MTYYSALHYAAKAEKSATNAANSAEIAQTAAAQASQSSGKVVQIGFDGFMENGRLVFKHSPAGVDIPYDLLDDYEYEIDMVYQGSDLADDVELVVRNGADTINFVSALHRDSTTPVTVKDMKSVMRYDESTGYRWLFKAAFKVTPLGDKVLLLYPVVAAKDYSDRTNCITEIPQDIKLELNNGVLTLKAGSKVYMPNGFEADGTTPKFDVVVVSEDKTMSTAANGVNFLTLNSVDSLAYNAVSRATSGATAPTSSGYWYNTTENKIKYYNGSSISNNDYSLPVAIFSVVDSVISSIDQIFNGFGYIGSTVFALPGVKGLIPNGRNADGSLRNIEARTDSVITYTNTNPNNKWYSFVSPVNGIWTKIDFKTDNHLSLGTQSSGWFFDENANYWMYNGNKSYNWVDFAHSANNTTSPFAITSFTPKTAFQAVDRNDSSWLSGIGMPSERYIDLTLGGSGAGYTAPANGYFTVSKAATGAAQYVIINMFYDGGTAKRISNASYSPGSGYGCLAWLPVRKGDRVHISYTAAGETKCFMFVYAEGEN